MRAVIKGYLDARSVTFFSAAYDALVEQVPGDCKVASIGDISGVTGLSREVRRGEFWKGLFQNPRQGPRALIYGGSLIVRTWFKFVLLATGMSDEMRLFKDPYEALVWVQKTTPLSR